MPTVFLLHNHADKPFVRRLATDLSIGGAGIWIDELEMKIGDSLIERIGKGITDSDYLAVVLSRNSVSSAWVNQELEIALTQQINGAGLKVLPLRLGSTMPHYRHSCLGSSIATFRTRTGIDKRCVNSPGRWGCRSRTRGKTRPAARDGIADTAAGHAGNPTTTTCVATAAR